MRSLIFLLVLCSTAAAVEITPTQILGHGDPVPRFSSHGGQVLIVPAGETVTLPVDSTWDAIEVAGTLKASEGSKLRFQHLTILPTGTLELPKSGEWIIKDVPIDTEVDPFQIGNGILNYGTWKAQGEPKTGWSHMQPAETGAMSISVVDAIGWKVGDELLLPDTRQISGTTPIRREAPITIAAIAGNVLTLSKPLDFEHHAINGLLPIVGNLTRSFVIRSENPLGTRGHTINMVEAHADVRHIALLDLGRTLPVTLDNTTADAVGNITHVGTNQVARYAFHWHHVHAHHEPDPSHPHIGHIVGCVLTGSDVGKWGIVQHGTHSVHIEGNVCDNFVGAGVVAEDGNECFGFWKGNLATYCRGNGNQALFNWRPEITNAPGAEGAGFALHGSHHTLTGNVAANCTIGFIAIHDSQVTRVIDGAPADWEAATATPIEFSGNVAFSNRLTGLEEWRTPRGWTAVDTKLYHNGLRQVLFGNGQGGHLAFDNLHAFASGNKTVGIESSRAYSSGLLLENSVIEGCETGLKNFRFYYTVRNTRLKNGLDISLLTGTDNELIRGPLIEFDSVKCEGDQFIAFHEPAVISYPYYDQTGYRVLLKNWQQQGKDYTLHREHFTRDRPALAAKTPVVYVPEDGLTFGQAWDKYGLGGPDGGPVPPDAVPLAGTNGFARELVGEFPLGPPRCIICYPNMMRPFTERDFWVAITGKPVEGGGIAVEIDGHPATYRTELYMPPTRITRVASPTLRDPGTHTIKTWRTTAAGERLPESEMEFKYFVGEPSEPPQPEPEPKTLEQRVTELESRVRALEGR